MCVIAVSMKGVKQPNQDQLKRMFEANPDGAGYMFARDGKVYIHKGFMTWDDFSRNVKLEHFTKADPVVYHFRIATQAGVIPEMTHPFPLTRHIEDSEILDCSCNIGVAHNGIIRMTSNGHTRYSDTAIFVADFMSRLIRCPDDITDTNILTMIDELTNSKWAIMNGSGEITTVGHFQEENGILFSNGSYKRPCKTTIKPPLKFDYDDYLLGYYGIKC